MPNRLLSGLPEKRSPALRTLIPTNRRADDPLIAFAFVFIFLFLIPAQLILHLGLKVLPSLSKPLPACIFIPQALDCFGQGIAKEKVLRLLAAVDTELTGIGKVLTIME